MTHFEHRTDLAVPRSEAFAWHERRGAIHRLAPPSAMQVVQEPSDGVRDGSTTVLRILAPATGGRVGFRWVARHLNYAAGERFEDVMEHGPLRSWHHRHLFADGPDGGTVLTDSIELSPGLPTVSGQLTKQFDYRGRQLVNDFAVHARYPERKRFVVTGASGLVGTQLVAFLRTGGHEVWTLTRGPADPARQELHWNPDADELDPNALERADVVIHLAGEPIGSRFTAQHKEKVLQSRTRSTALLARTLAELGGDRVFLCASASGFYGPDRGSEVLTEDAKAGHGFLAEVVTAWEDACAPARAAGLRVVNVRTGIVQSPAGGQLQLQLPLYELGLGGRLGNGRQWMPWIGIDDLVYLFTHLAFTDVEGPVNACAPNPVTGRDYARTLGRVLHRPAVLPVPSFGPAVLLGREGAREMALSGQRMLPERATASGFEFVYPELKDTLRHVLAR